MKWSKGSAIDKDGCKWYNREEFKSNDNLNRKNIKGREGKHLISPLCPKGSCSPPKVQKIPKRPVPPREKGKRGYERVYTQLYKMKILYNLGNSFRINSPVLAIYLLAEAFAVIGG